MGLCRFFKVHPVKKSGCNTFLKTKPLSYTIIIRHGPRVSLRLNLGHQRVHEVFYLLFVVLAIINREGARNRQHKL